MINFKLLEPRNFLVIGLMALIFAQLATQIYNKISGE